jgi:2-polyprenyl-3-methyl-5-hydroxy-6-metoxy-1,4-benzoquinol methylase
MTDHAPDAYGWNSAQASCSDGYVFPKVVGILSRLGVKRVLDVGAGTGQLCVKLAHLGYDAVGAEYDKEGVEIARSAYPALRFYQFGVQDNPAELLRHEQPFDAVISTEVVEHLFSPHLLPLYAGAVLKPGGHLIVTTPYHGYLKNLALSLADKWDHHHTALWHGGHIKFWSRATLTQLLSENGFRVVDFFGIGRVPYLWRSMGLLAEKI